MTQENGRTYSDPLDQASALEMESNEQALKDVQRACKRDQEPDKHGVYAVLDCLDCGNEIGEGRLQVSIKNHLCIHCATLRERRR